MDLTDKQREGLVTMVSKTARYNCACGKWIVLTPGWTRAKPLVCGGPCLGDGSQSCGRIHYQANGIGISPELTTRPGLVLFHSSCMDGAGAAAAAYRALGEAAEYRPVQYGTPAPTDAEVEGREVFILDFCYPRDEIERIGRACAGLVVVDHHKTAEAALAGKLDGRTAAFFDMEHSGAVLAWRFFHGDEPPMILQYIEDRDLWRWKLPHSQAASAALASLGFDYRWIANACWLVFPTDVIINDGSAILRVQQQYVAQVVALAEPVAIDGIPGRAANCPLLQSDVADQLAKETGTFGAAWWWDGALRHYVVSLRARGDLDVSEIARRHGGGGHLTAAGFECAELPWARKDVP